MQAQDIPAKKLIIIKPVCDVPERKARLEEALGEAIDSILLRGVEVEVFEKMSDLECLDLRNSRIIFAVALTETGINMEYYGLLESLRKNTACLTGSVGGIIIDGASELFTKAIARRLAFSANLAGCTFPGKPLVEATGSLGNFFVLSGIRGEKPYKVYKDQLKNLLRKVYDFKFPRPDRKLKLMVVHASSRSTSNSLLLWGKIKSSLEDRVEIKEISLRNGELTDCRGCGYKTCRHFGEQEDCFYGGIITEQAYPAIIECDALLMICPNYNDAIGANLTAFINRLTAIFHVHDFSRKRVYAIVISGYSGGDIVAEQVIGALNFNKGFILPGNFSMVETANDPKSILKVKDIDIKAEKFADIIR